MSDELVNDYARLHAAFSDKIRIDLFLALRERWPLRPTDAAPLVGRTRQDCSHHLRKLSTYGLVEAADLGNGREQYWRIRAEATAVDPSFGSARVSDLPRVAAGVEI